MVRRPIILEIPRDTEQITVSYLVGNELIVEDYDMKDIEKVYLNPEGKDGER